jgi:hypothetical protein
VPAGKPPGFPARAVVARAEALPKEPTKNDGSVRVECTKAARSRLSLILKNRRRLSETELYHFESTLGRCRNRIALRVGVFNFRVADHPPTIAEVPRIKKRIPEAGGMEFHQLYCFSFSTST